MPTHADMTKSISSRADFYQILGVPFTGTSTGLSRQTIKLAYHKALLRHHPDKASAIEQGLQAPSNETSDARYSIDEITTAYKTLSDPVSRAEYDRALRLDRAKVAEREKTDVFHTGLEIVDLEDLQCDEGGEEVCWFRECRCGDDRGFLVTEDELEREVEHGEIIVGCRGCSLWLKVLFAVEDDG